MLNEKSPTGHTGPVTIIGSREVNRACTFSRQTPTNCDGSFMFGAGKDVAMSSKGLSGHLSSIPTNAGSNNKQQTTDHRQYATTRMGYSADDRLPFGPSQDVYKEQLSPSKMALAMANILSFHHQPGRIDRRSLPSNSYTFPTPSFPT
jgi:hypothetical protein